MARRAQHLRCSLSERSERGDNKLDKLSLSERSERGDNKLDKLCIRVPGILESKFWQHLVPRIFSDKISVLLEHAAQSVTQERPLKL